MASSSTSRRRETTLLWPTRAWDATRLIEEGSSFDRALLRAGREDRPSSDFARRVLAVATRPVTGVVEPSLDDHDNDWQDPSPR